MSVAYDSATRATSVSNGAGTWSYAYSTSGTTETTTVTDPNGNKKTYVSNTALDVVTSYTDAMSRVTTYGYDSYGRVTSVSYPHGDVITYTYDENETSARGNITTTTWTPAGGGTAIVTTAGYDSSCTYPAKCNKPNWTRDGKGAETDYAYDTTYNTGLLTIVSYPAGANGLHPQTRYTYSQLAASGFSGSPIWLLTQTSSCNTTTSCSGTADETRTTISYNANANLAVSSVVTAAGDGSVSSTQSFTYDAFGNVLTVTSPLGGVTRNRYDADRELVGVTAPDPDGSGPLVPTAQKYDYDGGGRLQYVEYGTVPSQSDSDWANFSQSYYDYYTYDAQNRVVGKRRGPYGGAATNYIQYTYDNANRLTCSAVRMNAGQFGSDPASACTLGSPNSSGPDQITQYNYYADDTVNYAVSGYGTPQSHTSHVWSYNTDGTLSIDWDGKNNATCYSYDGFARKTVAYYETPGQSAQCNGSDYDQYGYDANGNMTSWRKRDGVSYSFSYDALNHMTSGIDGDSYTYDNLGRPTGAVRTNGGTVQESFAYDALGRTTSTTRTGLGTISYQYDAAGDRTRLTWPDGFYVGYNYDVTGKMTSVLETGITTPDYHAIATFSYDSLGRLTSSERGSQVSLGYSYDNVSRLSQISYAYPNSGSNTFLQLGYDEADQIVWRQFTNGGVYDWAPNESDIHIGYGLDGLNRVTSAGGGSFSYDAKGDLTSDSVNSYSYNGHNWMTGANGASLVYDALGRVASVTSSGSTTQFLYDGSDLIAEYDGSGNLLRRHIHGASGDDIVGWYENSSGRRYLLPDNQGWLCQPKSGTGLITR